MNKITHFLPIFNKIYGLKQNCKHWAISSTIDICFICVYLVLGDSLIMFFLLCILPRIFLRQLFLEFFISVELLSLVFDDHDDSLSISEVADPGWQSQTVKPISDELHNTLLSLDRDQHTAPFGFFVQVLALLLDNVKLFLVLAETVVQVRHWSVDALVGGRLLPGGLENRELLGRRGWGYRVETWCRVRLRGVLTSGFALRHIVHQGGCTFSWNLVQGLLSSETHCRFFAYFLIINWSLKEYFIELRRFDQQQQISERMSIKVDQGVGTWIEVSAKVCMCQPRKRRSYKFGSWTNVFGAFIRYPVQTIKLKSSKRMEGKEWELRPSRQTISGVKHTSDLSAGLSDKEILSIISNFSRELPNFRVTRSDGNSFYRSVAFNYLRQQNIGSFEECFPDMESLDLVACKSIPGELTKYYKDSLLRSSFKSGWEVLFRPPSAKTKEDRLVTALNKYLWLDFLIIIYFRCLVHHTISTNQDLYRKFAGYKSMELSKVTTFGHEPESIEIYALVNSIKFDVDIFLFSKKGVVRQKYHIEKPASKLSILLREGHYDVLCVSQRSERHSIRQKVQFKLDSNDSSLNTSLNKSFQSNTQSATSRRAIMKKASWGSANTDHSQSFEIDADYWSSVDWWKVSKIALGLLVLVMAIVCVFKASFYGASSLETRSEWEWREEYVAFETHKIQNPK